jgi:hypothetical protein
LNSIGLEVDREYYLMAMDAIPKLAALKVIQEEQDDARR